jgi:hypothetical protein
MKKTDVLNRLKKLSDEDLKTVLEGLDDSERLYLKEYTEEEDNDQSGDQDNNSFDDDDSDGGELSNIAVAKGFDEGEFIVSYHANRNTKGILGKRELTFFNVSNGSNLISDYDLEEYVDMNEKWTFVDEDNDKEVVVSPEVVVGIIIDYNAESDEEPELAYVLQQAEGLVKVVFTLANNLDGLLKNFVEEQGWEIDDEESDVTDNVGSDEDDDAAGEALGKSINLDGVQDVPEDEEEKTEAVRQHANGSAPYYVNELGYNLIFYIGSLTSDQEEELDEAFESFNATKKFESYKKEFSDMEELEASTAACQKMIDEFCEANQDFKPDRFTIQTNWVALEKAGLAEKVAVKTVNEETEEIDEAAEDSDDTAVEDEGDGVEFVFQTDRYDIVYTGTIDSQEQEDLMVQAFESDDAIKKYDELLEITEDEIEAAQKLIDGFCEENEDYTADQFYVDQILPNVAPNVFKVGDDVVITYTPNDLTDEQIETFRGFFESEETYADYERMEESDGPEEAAKTLVDDFCQENIGFEAKDFDIEITEEEKAEQELKEEDEEITEDAKGVSFPEFKLDNYCTVYYTGGNLTGAQLEEMNEFFASSETYTSFKQLGQNEDAARKMIQDLCEKNPEFDVQGFDVKIDGKGEDEDSDEDLTEDNEGGKAEKKSGYVTYPEFELSNYCTIYYTAGQLTKNQYNKINEFFGSGEAFTSFKQLGQNEDAARQIIKDFCEKNSWFDEQDFDVKMQERDLTEFSILGHVYIRYTGGNLSESQSDSIGEYFGSDEIGKEYLHLGKNEYAAKKLIRKFCEENTEFNEDDFKIEMS